jgi:uncharacterized membrane protein
MFGLTSLGIVHTIISLFAVGAGAIALIRDRKISWNNALGKFYIVTTIVVCLTGFGIFQHGGFGKPHALGIITLLVIGAAFAAGEKTKLFGKFSPFIETVCYSLTFFFHFIPALAESATRLPLGAPLASSPDDPRIQAAVGVCFVLFLIGAALQIRILRAALNATAK